MNINAEQKKMYFTETALALNREGFRAETILGGTLGVWLDDERSVKSARSAASPTVERISLPQSVWPQRIKPTGSSALPLNICGRWNTLLLSS